MSPSRSGFSILRVLAFFAGAALIVFDLLIDRFSAGGEAGFGLLQYLLLAFGLLVCAAAFYRRSWKEGFTRVGGKIAAVFTKLASLLAQAQQHWYLFEFLALLAVMYAYFASAAARPDPAGYAGLFQLEIDTLLAHRFSLPQTLPYYGPGGIPAAYPFLGLYLGALVQRFLQVSAFDYLRFAPAAWTTGALVAGYFFFKKVTGERVKAVSAVLLMALTFEIYEKHATAAGIVRAPALLFMILALTGLWGITRTQKTSFWAILLTGLAAALTAMSHLSYLTFLVISGLTLLLCARETNLKTRLLRLAGVGLFGTLFSSPWWGVVLSRYGFATFLNAFNSHGTLELVGKLAAGNLKSLLLALFAGWGEIALLGLTLLGLAWCLVRRRALYLCWFVLVFLLLGDNTRFLILIGALISAELVVEVLRCRADTQTEKTLGQITKTAAALLLLLGFLWARFQFTVRQAPQALDSDLVEAAGWLRENTPPQARYLFFSGSHDKAEWIPWLSARVPAVGHWGAEWNGDYDLQYARWKELSDCADLGAAGCLTAFDEENSVDYEYILSDSSAEGTSLLQEGLKYEKVFENKGYFVFKVN